MNNCITNFTHNSTLKSSTKKLSRIKIYNSTELRAKKKKQKECVSQRLNDLARPNVRRIRSIFEKQKKKSKFDMIKAEKLLKLMNEPPKKPYDVKKCLGELTKGIKNRQECVAKSRDVELEKCRQQLRNFQCMTDKKVLKENQKLNCNNSFKPQKNAIVNSKKSFTQPRTNNKVSNFKVSTKKNITIEELERRCRNNNFKPVNSSRANNEVVIPKISKNVNNKEVSQNSRMLQNFPLSLFIGRDNEIVEDQTGKIPFRRSESPLKSTAVTKNKSVIYPENSIKINSNFDPQEFIRVSRQYIFDSGFEERIDNQKNVTTTNFMASPSPKVENKEIKVDDHSNIEDPIVGQAIEVSDDSIDNLEVFVDQNSTEFDSNLQNPKTSIILPDSNQKIPNFSSTSNSLSNQALNITTDSQLEDPSTSQENSIQNYSYPDIYENFSISLLTEDDSSILKLSSNSTSLESPQNFIRQSSFNKSTDIRDFKSFISKQEVNSSRNLPVIALRDFTGYHDVDIDTNNEILVRVKSSNFDKIYVVTKIEDERNLKEFCQSSVSSRSKLFLMNDSKDKQEIEVKKLGTKFMKFYCGKEHEGSSENYTKNSLLSSINHEKFSVQKLNRTTKNPGINIHVTQNSTKKSNFTVIKEQSRV